MRTINEIKRDMDGPGHKHLVSAGELKHMLEIVTEADLHIQHGLNSDKLTKAINKARTAGLLEPVSSTVQFVA